MKFLYVLTSNEKDIYLEQTYISIVSLRIYMPNAFVSLLLDTRTNENLINDRAKIRELVNEIVVKQAPENLTNMQINRFLKTSMREHIKGDFLYVDGDTIFCGQLEEISKLPHDVMLALDFHSEFDSEIYLRKMPKNSYGFIKKNFRNIPKRSKFFNGGVIWCRDTEAGHHFFAKWHENWKKTCESGIFTDQTALTLTNFELNAIQELDGKYNCQIWFGVNYLHSAKILHYFAASDSKYEPFSTELPFRLKNNWAISDSDMECIKKPRCFYKAPNRIITENDYKVFHSELGCALRLLVKKKRLFDLLNLPFKLFKRVALGIMENV
ncbi:MAG: hypothetical protein FWH22_09005 [Fibromonadales bacterium]|nr:hypothetical protein [Fibromonadales bacterium]